MKKYILIIIVGISVLLGAILSSNRIIIENLQATSIIYSPGRVAIRVRDSKLDISWEHHPDNPWPVHTYRVYYGTSSVWPYGSSLEVSGLYRWAELSDLTNSNIYYIQVTAIDGGVESDTSIAGNRWVAVPSPADTTVYRNISGGTTASAYTMVSTPVEPEDNSIRAVLCDDLGPYDNTQWRCFHWESDDYGYEEVTSSTIIGGHEGREPAVGGAGWLISRNNVTIDITGAEYDSIYPSGPDQYHIRLNSNWNQIGCPYNVRVAWSSVEVEDPYNPGTWRQVTDSELNTWTNTDVWGWYNGAYYSMINLVPTYGFFIYNKMGCIPITLRVTRPAFPPSPPDRSYGPGGYSPRAGEDFYPDIKAPSYRDGGPPPPPPGFVSADASSGGGGGCFIATAAYGTEMAEEVVVLRKFRDQYLSPNPFGRTLIKFYYRNSPPLADSIKDKPVLKAIVRINLKPLIWFSRLVTR